MTTWLCSLIAAAIFGLIGYLLYCRDIAVTRCMRALVFLFRPRRDGDTVTLDACSGWLRHVGRFRESGTYAFTLDAQLSAGDVEVLVLDGAMEQLLKLDRRSPSAEIALDGRKRYYIRWEFRGAAGRCALRWGCVDGRVPCGSGLFRQRK